VVNVFRSIDEFIGKGFAYIALLFRSRKMCSPQNEALVHEVLDEKIAADEMFTAWDVTSEAKKRGADERHGILKGAVHSRWDYLRAAGYRRAPVDIPGVAVPPWVYYPLNADPQDYLNSSAVNVVTPAADDDDVDVDANGDVDIEDDAVPTGVVVGTAIAVDRTSSLLTKEGRLNIPADMLRSIGARHGKIVEFHSKDDELFVVEAGDAVQDRLNGADAIRACTINSDGRMRISSDVLKRAGMNGTRFYLERDGGLIVVTEA